MKKIICIVLAAIMIFALVACNSTQEGIIDSAHKSEIELEQHKIAAKERLDAYVIEKGEDNYTAENWAKMNGCVETGKAAIDEATNKQEIDDKILKAKSDMDDIPIIAFDIVEFSGWKSISGMLNNRIKLSNFRNDVVYECSVDGGDVNSEKSYGKEIIVSPGEIIQWYPSDFYGEKREGLAFMEIRAKSGENIVGYALLEFYYIGFYYVEEEPYYDSERVEARSYQPVRLITEAYTAKSKLSFTEEYVDEIIDKAKNYEPIMSDEFKQYLEQESDSDYHITYYGEYNGAQVILVNLHLPAAEYLQVAGVRFSWGVLHSFLAYKDGKSYSIDMKNYWGYDYEQSDALENGILTQRDIEIIGGLYGRLKK